MFPLGSVLFPHMPLALRVFEERYRVMLARVLTGEGALDAQTAAGKTPAGVLAVAARHRVPVIAFAGRLGEGIAGLGFAACVPIVEESVDLATALREGAANLERAVAEAVGGWLGRDKVTGPDG